MSEPAAESERDERPLGELTDFAGADRPDGRELRGRYVTLRPPAPARDAGPLYRISHAPAGDPTIWDYLPDGPFADVDAYRAWLEAAVASVDPRFYTVVVEGTPAGVVSLLAIVPEHGTIEIGHVWFGPALARTSAATEAIFLLARHAFDELGHRVRDHRRALARAPGRLRGVAGAGELRRTRTPAPIPGSPAGPIER